jgi:hypothetical protein
MQVKNISLVALALAAVTALSACPGKKPPSESVALREPAVSSQPRLEPGEQVVEGVSESGEAATAETLDQKAIDAIPEGDEISGQWFALYGSSFGGPVKFDYANGHVIDFKENNSADWIIRRDGSQVAVIPTRYRLDGGSLVLDFNQESLFDSRDFSSQTPLGFGRDKEIGLSAGRDSVVGLSGGRDKEVGLKENLPAGSPNELKLALISDGRFLALTDAFNHLMVYGRVKNPGTSLASGLKGDWQGHMRPQERFDASFSLDGTRVSAVLAEGRGNFEGVLTQGYVVGEISRGETRELAAILPETADALNGVYTPAPYNELRLQFDFSRAPAQS